MADLSDQSLTAPYLVSLQLVGSVDVNTDELRDAYEAVRQVRPARATDGTGDVLMVAAGPIADERCQMQIALRKPEHTGTAAGGYTDYPAALGTLVPFYDRPFSGHSVAEFDLPLLEVPEASVARSVHVSLKTGDLQVEQYGTVLRSTQVGGPTTDLTIVRLGEARLLVLVRRDGPAVLTSASVRLAQAELAAVFRSIILTDPTHAA